MRCEAFPQLPSSCVAVLVADPDGVPGVVAGGEDHDGPEGEVGRLGPGSGEQEGEGLVLGDVQLVQRPAVKCITV